MDTKSLYGPLDESRREIRLLTLLPCEKHEERIACRLETASLTDDCEYAAMSYVWGDATNTTEILVNNIAFQASINLVLGLLHFRGYGLGLPGKKDCASLPRLWIDAICINQQDTGERNRQVALMGEIYTSARYVLTWLGSKQAFKVDGEICPIHKSFRLMRNFSQGLPSRLKQVVIDTLESRIKADDSAEGYDDDISYENDNGGGKQHMRVGDGANPETELVQEGLKWISEHSELFAPYENEPSNKLWVCFRGLTQLPYWQRVWIQQERFLCRAFAANLVRLGAEVVTFEDLVLFYTFVFALDRRAITPPEINELEWAEQMLNIEVSIIGPMIGMRALWKRGVPSPDLVLFMAEKCKATDPRDMVYGLRSLLNLKVAVDYDKTVREVYLDWHAEAVEHFRARGELETCGISRAGRGISEENLRDLPSWMPDLAIIHQGRYVSHQREGAKLGPGGRFQLVGAEGQQYSEDGVLSVYGVVCDRVCRTSLLMIDRNDSNKALGELAVDYALEMKTRDHPTGLRPLQALFYTIHQGTDPETRKPFPPTLDPRSVSALIFKLQVLEGQTTDPRQDWSHVDLEAVGGIDAYLESRFIDTTNADEDGRWWHTMCESSDYAKSAAIRGLEISHHLFCNNKAFFYTTDGYIGIGPEYLQVGDQLCVINNCHLPVLLREEGSGHVLVGAVYVYGLCEDESLHMLEAGKVKLTRFEIH